MRQKLITLCPNSFELAQKKNNFSEWVRTKLLEEADIEVKPIKEYLFKCQACNAQLVRATKHQVSCHQCGWLMSYVPSVQLTLGGLHDEL